jgi:hypothetical protein
MGSNATPDEAGVSMMLLNKELTRENLPTREVVSNECDILKLFSKVSRRNGVSG